MLGRPVHTLALGNSDSLLLPGCGFCSHTALQQACNVETWPLYFSSRMIRQITTDPDKTLNKQQVVPSSLKLKCHLKGPFAIDNDNVLVVQVPVSAR